MEFAEEAAFSKAFAEIFLKVLKRAGVEAELTGAIADFIGEERRGALRELLDRISGLCEKVPMPVIAIIDEADSAANNQVFLDFLALLRRFKLTEKIRLFFIR